MAQQQLSPDTVCAYPVTTNAAVDMIKNKAWVEDNKKTHAHKLNRYKKNDNDKKNGKEVEL